MLEEGRIMGNETPFWRQLLNGWMAIAGRFGFVQTLLLLALSYILLIGPIWTVTSIARRDFLAKRGLGSKESAWLEADTAEPDLGRAKLQS
jgi:predicted membrane-bound spermidine synthase